MRELIWKSTCNYSGLSLSLFIQIIIIIIIICIFSRCLKSRIYAFNTSIYIYR